MTTIANLSGFKGEIITINKIDIKNAILRGYSGLSFEDITIAFQNERYCIYEAKTKLFNSFNAEYVSEILAKYVKWKRKTKIDLNITFSNPVTALPEKSPTAIMQEGVKRLFEEYKKTNTIDEFQAHIYDYLLQNGEIQKPTEQKRTELISTAKKNLRKTATKPRLERKDKKFIKIIRAEQPSTDVVDVANECKRLELINYFKNKQLQENE